MFIKPPEPERRFGALDSKFCCFRLHLSIVLLPQRATGAGRRRQAGRPAGRQMHPTHTHTHSHTVWVRAPRDMS